MACIYICDGCGKKMAGVDKKHYWRKPRRWFQRLDEEGIQDACSRECIKNIAKKTGKTHEVAPY